VHGQAIRTGGGRVPHFARAPRYRTRDTPEQNILGNYTDSIHGESIAKTCTRCHAQIETVHRKVIRGELWEKQPNLIPACVDCHQPHKVRRVYYPQGLADRDFAYR
jgi:NAD-dependent SIR2 family protein deacetylase